jgi:hypothetical protein
VKVFISWSGTRGQLFAQALAVFLRRVVQAVDPFVSSEIDKGAKWRNEISAELELAVFGIVCVTRDSMASEWLHFEAGALSRRTNLWTFLLDVAPANLRDPLGQFQHTRATDRDDVLKFFRLVNEKLRDAAARSLLPEDLQNSFEKHWPEYSAALAAIPQTAAKPAVRNVAEMVEEILDVVRALRLPVRLAGPMPALPPFPGIHRYRIRFASTLRHDHVSLMIQALSNTRNCILGSLERDENNAVIAPLLSTLPPGKIAETVRTPATVPDEDLGISFSKADGEWRADVYMERGAGRGAEPRPTLPVVPE